jgi:hypothetical protein
MSEKNIISGVWVGTIGDNNFIKVTLDVTEKTDKLVGWYQRYNYENTEDHSPKLESERMFTFIDYNVPESTIIFKSPEFGTLSCWVGASQLIGQSIKIPSSIHVNLMKQMQ